MFHRKRSASNPARRPPPIINSTAQLAASQAFLKDRASHATLSSAAAAAALRAHPPTPTAVGDVQTKRMIRRGSLSSAGSSAGRGGSPLQQGALQRQNSSGSMTERTFRTSSPNHVSPQREPPLHIPPVPAIPQNLVAQQHRRTVSHDPSSHIPVPQSRIPQTDGGGKGLLASKHNPKQPRVTSMPQMPDAARPDSRRSAVNFSYPISPQSSPRSSPVLKTTQGGWFTRPATTDSQLRNELPPVRPKPPHGIRSNDLTTTAHQLREVAERPVPKEKKRASLPPQGTRLGMGGMQSKPWGTAVDEARRAKAEQEAVKETTPAAVAPPRAEAESAKPDTGIVTHDFAVERPPVRQRAPAEEPAPVQRRDHNVPKHEPERPKTEPSAVVSARPRSIQGAHLEVPLESVEMEEGELHTEPTEPTTKSKAVEQRERIPSASPTRSAHFGPVAVASLDGVKHHPPPRSVSPAKSALKHSPSSPVRTTSPPAALANGPTRLSFSEASDTMSDDGMRGAGRRKHVRVSFEEPKAVLDSGTSSPESSASPVPKGLSKSKWSVPAAPEDELKEVMKPRPALPSFGSIRGRRAQSEDEVPEKVTETVSSSLSASISTIGEPLEASSDHALGHIISHDVAKKLDAKADGGKDAAAYDPLAPIPPEVTSVEGSGYFSDSDDSSTHEAVHEAQDAEELAAPASPLRPPTPPLGSEAAKPSAEVVTLPSIAVQPATPRPEDAPEDDESPELNVPGGFPGEREVREKHQNPSQRTAVVIQESITIPPAPSQPAQRVVAEAAATRPKEEPILDHTPLSTLEEESEDGDSSIYSDAVEEFTDDDDDDDDGRGFASIDAVVESVPEPGLAITTQPKSPVVAVQPEAARIPPPSEEHADWDKTKAYWSDLSQTRTKEAPRQGQSTATNNKPTALPQPAKRKKKTAVSQPGPVQATAAPSQAPVAQRRAAHQPAQPAAQPKKSVLKQTMRGSQAEHEPHDSYASRSQQDRPIRLQTTMRGPGLAASKYSNQNEHPEPRVVQKTRIPQQSSPTTPRPKTAPGLAASMHNPSNISRIGAPLKKAPVPDGNDSDASASSFQRSPRPKPMLGRSNRHTMRSSMRGAADPYEAAPTLRGSPPQAAAPPPSKFSIRSLSPNGGFLRRSMRSPSGETKPPPSKTSFLSSKPKPVSPPKSKSRFVSRFADSSDEEENVRPAFRSRFADSDDDDLLPESLTMPKTMPAGLTPVRGIPRRPGEEDGDSTDLEDENSDAEGLSATNTKDVEKQIAGGKKRKGTSQGGILTKGGLRDSKHAIKPTDAPESSPTAEKEKGKRRFFGLGKRRVSSGPGALVSLPRPSTPPPQQEGRRPDTASAPVSPAERPKSPKLQRRAKPFRVLSDSFTLTQAQASRKPTAEDRPQSQDRLASFGASPKSKTVPDAAAGPSARPKPPGRVLSTDSLGTNGTAGTTGPYFDDKGRVVDIKPGKKKKFPLLRKVFRRGD